jgi:hypothetical protein
MTLNTTFWSLPSNTFTNTPLVETKDRRTILSRLEAMENGKALPGEVQQELLIRVPEDMRNALGRENLEEVCNDFLGVIQPAISGSLVEFRKVQTYKGDGGGSSHGYGVFATTAIPAGTKLEFLKGITIPLAKDYQVFFPALSYNLNYQKECLRIRPVAKKSVKKVVLQKVCSI